LYFILGLTNVFSENLKMVTLKEKLILKEVMVKVCCSKKQHAS
jgi:hypothetical protein